MSKLSPQEHIATIVVLATAMVQSHDTKNARATQELTACLLATARALPREEVDRLVALVGAPVVELLVVEETTADAKVTP